MLQAMNKRRKLKAVDQEIYEGKIPWKKDGQIKVYNGNKRQSRGHWLQAKLYGEVTWLVDENVLCVLEKVCTTTSGGNCRLWTGNVCASLNVACDCRVGTACYWIVQNFFFMCFFFNFFRIARVQSRIRSCSYVVLFINISFIISLCC